MKSRYRFSIALLPLLDYLAAVLSFYLAYSLRDYLDNVFLLPPGQFLKLALLLSLLWPLTYIISDLYSFSLRRGSLEEFFKIIVGSSSAATLTLAAVYLLKEFAFSRLILLLTWALSIFFVWLARAASGGAQRFSCRRGHNLIRVAIVGGGQNIDLVKRGFSAEPDFCRQLISAYEDINLAKAAIRKNKIDEVIYAGGNLNEKKVAEMLEECEARGVNFKFVPDIFHAAGVHIATRDLAGVPLIEVKPTLLDGWAVIIKRALDITLSGLALAAISPVLVLTAAAIKMDTPGPVLYRDRRVGRNGEEFDVIKFRSMHMLMKDGKVVHAKEDKKTEALKAKQKNYKLAHDPRVTRVGRFIRRTSIDELPQFWNVLRGEMSVVGPRAYRAIELAQQQERYPDTRALVRRLLTVKPGITGIWQVSGRSQVNFTERVAMDAYYATNATLLSDIKIILRTPAAVLKGSGAM